MSRLNAGMFSSDRPDWSTPQAFFDLIDAEFGFTLDAAATVADTKCVRFWSPEDDGLSQPWLGNVWCNPPYGRGIDQWVAKGYNEAQRNGSVVVMLIPARTDTRYWHDYVMRSAEVRLLRGRLVFGNGEARANAPFPSALVVFRKGDHSPAFSSIERGALTRRAAA